MKMKNNRNKLFLKSIKRMFKSNKKVKPNNKINLDKNKILYIYS
jgi:hypothetical protein